MQISENQNQSGSKNKGTFLFCTLQNNSTLVCISLWLFSLCLLPWLPSLIRNGCSSSLRDIFILHSPSEWRAILPDNTLGFLWLDQFKSCFVFDTITGNTGVGAHWLAYPCPSLNQSLDKRNGVNLLSSNLDLMSVIVNVTQIAEGHNGADREVVLGRHLCLVIWGHTFSS